MSNIRLELKGNGLNCVIGDIQESSLSVLSNNEIIKTCFSKAIAETLQEIFEDIKNNLLNSIRRRPISSSYNDVPLFILYRNALKASKITPESINLLSITELSKDKSSNFDGSPSRIRGRKWELFESDNPIRVRNYVFVPKKGKGRHNEGFMKYSPGKTTVFNPKDMRYKTRFVNSIINEITKKNFKNKVMLRTVQYLYGAMKVGDKNE